jgi:hypothetical protein
MSLLCSIAILLIFSVKLRDDKNDIEISRWSSMMMTVTCHETAGDKVGMFALRQALGYPFNWNTSDDYCGRNDSMEGMCC